MKTLNTKPPMKNFSFIGLAVVLITVVMLSQCKKDPYIPFCELHPDQCEDMERIKDHYYFKTGSWWMYQEVTSHQLDSQWVSKGWVNDCKFDLTIKTSLDDYDNNYWIKLLTNGQGCGEVNKGIKAAFIKQNITMPGNYIGELNISSFPYNEGDSTYNYVYNQPNNSACLIKIHDSIELLNKTYFNVLEYNLNYDPIQNKQKTKYFYAEGVGLIKKELIDSNQTWLLINYNVEQ